MYDWQPELKLPFSVKRNIYRVKSLELDFCFFWLLVIGYFGVFISTHFEMAFLDYG